MMTKRSNHMPTFTRRQTTARIAGVRRTRRSHNDCGTITLHVTIVQNAHAYGPVIRLTKTAFSYRLSPYHAAKSSVRYEKPTSDPVSSMMHAMRSRCLTVMYECRRIADRATISSSVTIPNPENTAPATKYGGKSVVCQPGSSDVAKSMLTIEWTEITSGVARPASTIVSVS